MQDGNILIITNINRAQSGDYICEAKNQHGQGLSKTLNLKVRGKSMNHTFKTTILTFVHYIFFVAEYMKEMYEQM